MFDERTAELDIWGGGVGAQTPRTNIWVKPPKLPGLQAGRARQLWGGNQGNGEELFLTELWMTRFRRGTPRGEDTAERPNWFDRFANERDRLVLSRDMFRQPVLTSSGHDLWQHLWKSFKISIVTFWVDNQVARETCFIKLYNRKPLSTYFPFSFVKIVFLFYINFLLQYSHWFKI